MMRLNQTIGIHMKKNGKLLLLIAISLLNWDAGASDVIKVAVIDTGFDFKSTWSDAKEKKLKKPVLCKTGHKDFTNTGVQDTHGHGTHVAGIISSRAKKKYCLLIIKAWDKKNKLNQTRSIALAFKYAVEQKVDIINYSGGGAGFDYIEYIWVKKALDDGIFVVAAAGNEGQKVDWQVFSVKTAYKRAASGDLIVYKYKITYINKVNLKTSHAEPKNTFFPAAYDPRIISVENHSWSGRLKSSNHGAAFNYKDNGKSVLSLQLNNTYGTMTGTSQATPKKTAEIINNWGL